MILIIFKFKNLKERPIPRNLKMGELIRD